MYATVTSNRSPRIVSVRSVDISRSPPPKTLDASLVDSIATVGEVQGVAVVMDVSSGVHVNVPVGPPFGGSLMTRI